MVGPDGLEPSTPRLSSACSNQLSYEPELGNPRVLYRYEGVVFAFDGGADRTRTGDVLLAKQVLYQLSYDPSGILDFGFSIFDCASVHSPAACRGSAQSKIQNPKSKINTKNIVPASAG